MSKTLLHNKAKELEEKLAKLSGPEWNSDSEEDKQEQKNKRGRIDDDKKKKTSIKKLKSDDFLALSAAARKRLAKGKIFQDKTQNKLKAEKPSSVVYLGHIPHGFYEEQMKGFLSQFGDIRRLRLSRSKKTANSRGYAFIEFKSAQVAEVVADTMDGYWLDSRKLVCHVVKQSEIHDKLFEGSDQTFHKIPWRKLERDRRTAPKTEEDARKCLNRLTRAENRKRRRLAQMGLDYDFPGYEAEAKKAYVKRKEEEKPTPASTTAIMTTTTTTTTKKRARSTDDQDSAPRKASSSSRIGSSSSSRSAPTISTKAKSKNVKNNATTVKPVRATSKKKT